MEISYPILDLILGIPLAEILAAFILIAGVIVLIQYDTNNGKAQQYVFQPNVSRKLAKNCTEKRSREPVSRSGEPVGRNSDGDDVDASNRRYLADDQRVGENRTNCQTYLTNVAGKRGNIPNGVKNTTGHQTFVQRNGHPAMRISQENRKLSLGATSGDSNLEKAKSVAPGDQLVMGHATSHVTNGSRKSSKVLFQKDNGDTKTLDKTDSRANDVISRNVTSSVFRSPSDFIGDDHTGYKHEEVCLESETSDKQKSRQTETETLQKIGETESEISNKRQRGDTESETSDRRQRIETESETSDRRQRGETENETSDRRQRIETESETSDKRQRGETESETSDRRQRIETESETSDKRQMVETESETSDRRQRIETERETSDKRQMVETESETSDERTNGKTESEICNRTRTQPVNESFDAHRSSAGVADGQAAEDGDWHHASESTVAVELELLRQDNDSFRLWNECLLYDNAQVKYDNARMRQENDTYRKENEQLQKEKQDLIQLLKILQSGKKLNDETASSAELMISFGSGDDVRDRYDDVKINLGDARQQTLGTSNMAEEIPLTQTTDSSEVKSTRDSQTINPSHISPTEEITAVQKRFLFQFVFVGDSGVGKTSFIRRLCEGRFTPRFNTTVGMDFLLKTIMIDGQEVFLQVWDTAGQERFRSMTRQYFRKADGIVVMFDVTSENSFKNVRSWIYDAQEGSSDGSVISIVGNKRDLVEGEKSGRVVTSADGADLAKEFNAFFYESSAKTGHGVNKTILDMVNVLVHRRKVEFQLNPSVVRLHRKRTSPEMNCCGMNTRPL